MSRRLLGVAAALAVAVLAAACDETPPSAPQTDGPSLGVNAAPLAPFACVFSGNPSLSNAANAYFTVSDDKRSANGFIALMQTAFGTNKNYAGARVPGFDLLALTGKVSRQGTGSSPAAGATLVQQAIQCMFDVGGGLAGDFAGWPTASQFDFASALTPAAGGAFYTRGGTSDATDPVIGNDASRIPPGGVTADGNVSGLAPGNAVTWPALLGGRVLLYGQPVTDGFDWKVIPRNTSFTPFAVVGICAAATAQTITSSQMVLQDAVGVIGFKDASAICSTTPSLAMLDGGGAFAVVRRMARFADQLLAPAPLQATAVATSLGGSATKAKGDKFTLQDVPTVQLTFTQKPPANVSVNTGRINLTVNVSTPPLPVGGVQVSLFATNNNGTLTQLLQASSASGGCSTASGATPVAPQVTLSTVSLDGTSQATNVSWTNLCVTKTGALTIFATSGAVGRSGGVGTANTGKFNIKP